jgi:hypothetical protein
VFLVRTFEVTSLQYGPGLRQAFADMSYDYHCMDAITRIGTGTSLVKKDDNGPALLRTLPGPWAHLHVVCISFQDVGCLFACFGMHACLLILLDLVTIVLIFRETLKEKMSSQDVFQCAFYSGVPSVQISCCNSIIQISSS